MSHFCEALRDTLATHAKGALGSLVGVGRHLLEQRMRAVLARVAP